MNKVNKDFFKKQWNDMLGQLKLFVKECLPLAFILNLCIEGFSRESVLKPFLYALTSPIVFCYNTILICITLSLSFLFKRRVFVRFFIGALWLAAGIADFVLLQFRTTPFTGVDLLLIESALSIMNHYFTKFQIVLIFAAIILAVGIGIFLFFRAKKKQEGTNRLSASAMFLMFLLTGLLFTKLFMSVGVLERNFGNLAQSYHNNGFPYCFFSSIFGTGISKPDTYSEEEIDRIVTSVTKAPIPSENLNRPSPSPVPGTSVTPAVPDSSGEGSAGENDSTSDVRPNFIFLQLESFFDPTYLKGATFSADPVPFFRSLRENYSSGFLTVPSIGAGTANTEFEILTGINLDFFGPGEYPYKTILKETTCESIAYNLSALDYTTHAIHNNEGTFYGRHKVFSQLGFDTFTPIEYMGTYLTTPLGWPKDETLTRPIFDALNSTEGRDLIYAISVQGHGAFPEEKILADPEISILSLPEELEERHNELEYYVNQLHEMDDFLRRLTSMLSEYEEEVVLVMYGDHLPTFPFTDEMLDSKSIFNTEYIIWTNRPTDSVIKENLEAYRLTAHVLNCYNIHEGLFTRFHQTQFSSDTYMEDLKLLAYDVLYGDLESYDGVLPFKATDLQFGVKPIVLRNAVLRNDVRDYYCLFINGDNFTPYSVAIINGEEYNTTFINSQFLSVTGFELEDTLTVRVAQIGVDDNILSSTDSVVVSVEEEIYFQD